MRLEPLADEAVNVAAIVALVIVALEAGADPTTVVAAISGLGGYRMHQRRGGGGGPPSLPE